jgi:hypothetical protein
MKQKLLGTVALLAGLALVQSVPAMAQNPGAKGAQSQNAPSPQNSEQGKAGQDAPKANRAEPRSESRDKAAGQREEHQRGAAQQNERGGAQNDRNERREQGQRQEPQRTPSQREGQAIEKSQAQDKENKTGQSQQTPRDADRGQAQSQPNPTGADRERMNQQGQRTPTSSEQPSQEARQSEGTVNLSAEQRTRIRTTVFAGNNVPRVNNVNFSIRVGTVVPTSIRIVEVPPTLIEIYPQWRGHSYFVVRDEIIIVDSGHRIVSVVPVGTGDAAQYGGRDSDQGGVSVTTEDIRRVQVILRERGYVVEVDGVLGPQTRQAIIAFQRKEGFQATGEIDERTSVALGVGRDQPEGADRGRDNQQPTANRPAGQPTTGQGERGNPGRDDHGVDQSRGRSGNSSMDNAPQGHGVQPSEAKPSPKLDR